MTCSEGSNDKGNEESEESGKSEENEENEGSEGNAEMAIAVELDGPTERVMCSLRYYHGGRW